MLKKEILRRKDDFAKIYKRGKSIGERYIVLFYRKNNLSYNRTAFLASKKVGNSVKRFDIYCKEYYKRKKSLRCWKIYEKSFSKGKTL